MQEAHKLLLSAHELEEQLLASVSATDDQRKARTIPRPHIVSRTPHSVCLKYPPSRLPNRKVPTGFKVFAKPYGSGVGITTKSVDLPGDSL